MAIAKTYLSPSVEPGRPVEEFRIEYPPLPKSIDSLLDMISRPTHIDTASLIETVDASRDTSRRLYAIANSDHFGAGRTIDTPGRVVLTLGPTTVGALIVARELIAFGNTIEHMSGDHFANVVRHAAATAFLSRHSAEIVRTSQGGSDKLAPQHVNECFAAAMLHELGRFILISCRPNVARKLYDSIGEAGRDGEFAAIETSAFSCSPSTVGVDFARILGYPDIVTDFIRHHEADSDLRYPLHSVESRMIRATGCAHDAATRLGFSFPPKENDSILRANSLDPPSWQTFVDCDLPEATVEVAQSLVLDSEPALRVFMNTLFES